MKLEEGVSRTLRDGIKDAFAQIPRAQEASVALNRARALVLTRGLRREMYICPIAGAGDRKVSTGHLRHDRKYILYSEAWISQRPPIVLPRNVTMEQLINGIASLFYQLRPDLKPKPKPTIIDIDMNDLLGGDVEPEKPEPPKSKKFDAVAQPTAAHFEDEDWYKLAEDFSVDSPDGARRSFRFVESITGSSKLYLMEGFMKGRRELVYMVDWTDTPDPHRIELTVAPKRGSRVFAKF